MRKIGHPRFNDFQLRPGDQSPRKTFRGSGAADGRSIHRGCPAPRCTDTAVLQRPPRNAPARNSRWPSSGQNVPGDERNEKTVAVHRRRAAVQVSDEEVIQGRYQHASSVSTVLRASGSCCIQRPAHPPPSGCSIAVGTPFQRRDNQRRPDRLRRGMPTMTPSSRARPLPIRPSSRNRIGRLSLP